MGSQKDSSRIADGLQADVKRIAEDYAATMKSNYPSKNRSLRRIDLQLSFRHLFVFRSHPFPCYPFAMRLLSDCFPFAISSFSYPFVIRSRFSTQNAFML